MKIYVAAAYAARDHLRWEVVPPLLDAGHKVVSSWLEGDKPLEESMLGAAPAESWSAVAQHASDDIEEVRGADVVLHFTASALIEMFPKLFSAPLHTGGRHVETGVALAFGIPVVVVGEPENVFLRGLARREPNFGSALRFLGRGEATP